MKVADLLETQINGIFADDKILKCPLIALDAKDGKILFDTSKNKREYINKYLTGEIISLWADCKHMRGLSYGDYFKPVMKCYISHNSWMKESD